MRGLVDALIQRYQQDRLLLERARRIYPLGEEHTSVKPYVTVEVEATENLQSFKSGDATTMPGDFWRFNVLFRVRDKATERRRIESIMEAIRRVYDDETWAGETIEITGMVRVGETFPRKTEESGGLYEGEIAYDCYAARAVPLKV